MQIHVLLLVQLLAYGGLAVEHLIFGTLTHERLPITLTLIAIAFVGYSLSIWQVEENRGLSAANLWIGAFLFRALLLLTIPTLSSDIYRYLWDGYIANNGVSPYAFPIDSHTLDYLTHPIRQQANHTWMASPYLPAAQWLFRLVTGLLPIAPLSMQVVMVVVDLFNGLLILAILGLVGLPKYRAMIYLWNPLVVVEIAHGAHIDGWMIFLTLLVVWLVLWSTRNNNLRSSFKQHQTMQIRMPLAGNLAGILAPVILALATLTKVLPAFLVVVLFWRWRWWQLFLFIGVVAGFLTFAGTRAGWGLFGPLDGHGLFGALRIYSDQWNYNSGLFHWLEETLGPNGWVGWEMVAANQWAKRIVAALLLLTLGTLWLKARFANDARRMLRLMAVPFIAYVLLTATMHPWYLLLLLSLTPFLAPASDEAATQWLWVLPWLYLSGALFLSYLTYLDPQNLREYEWIRRTEWIPTLSLLVLAAVVRVGAADFLWQKLRKLSS